MSIKWETWRDLLDCIPRESLSISLPEFQKSLKVGSLY